MKELRSRSQKENEFITVTRAGQILICADGRSNKYDNDKYERLNNKELLNNVKLKHEVKHDAT